MPLAPIRTGLRDGTPVLIRPIEPEDAGLLQLGFSHLSDEARQFRFLRVVPQLSEDDLWFLTHPDHDGHEALGAADLSSDPPEPAGVARYVRLPDTPTAAEMAVTVVDDHQGRGLGTLLFGLLARVALSRGIDTFVALIHAENTGMRALLTDLGAQRVATHGTEREYRLPLQADPSRYPDTRAGDVFRTASRLAEDRLQEP